jgi:hypothetical protein
MECRMPCGPGSAFAPEPQNDNYEAGRKKKNVNKKKSSRGRATVTSTALIVRDGK